MTANPGSHLAITIVSYRPTGDALPVRLDNQRVLGTELTQHLVEYDIYGGYVGDPCTMIAKIPMITRSDNKPIDVTKIDIARALRNLHGQDTAINW